MCQFLWRSCELRQYCGDMRGRFRKMQKAEISLKKPQVGNPVPFFVWTCAYQKGGHFHLGLPSGFQPEWNQRSSVLGKPDERGVPSGLRPDCTRGNGLKYQRVVPNLYTNLFSCGPHHSNGTESRPSKCGHPKCVPKGSQPKQSN